MRRFIATICVLLAAATARAQSVNDEVVAYLTQNGISWTRGDWSTCDPAALEVVVGTDGLCSWNVAKLGAMPSAGQLSAMEGYVANQIQVMRYGSLITQGLAINSISTPSLNDTYGIDDATETHINSELSSIAVNGTFTNGQITKAWPNLAQTAAHTFTIAQFKTLVTAIGQYKDALVETKITLANGASAAWPANSATIP